MATQDTNECGNSDECVVASIPPLDIEQEEIARLLRDLERERPGSVARANTLIEEQTND